MTGYDRNIQGKHQKLAKKGMNSKGSLMPITPTLWWPQETWQFAVLCRAAEGQVSHQAGLLVSYTACS